MADSTQPERLERRQKRAGVLTRLLRLRSGAIGFTLSAFFLMLAVVGPYVAPFDPDAPDYDAGVLGELPDLDRWEMLAAQGTNGSWRR